MINNEKYYFAYGSNMDPRHMASLCPGTMALGRATLVDHRFLINRQGFATAVPAEQGRVHGVLWTISERHEQALDDYEAVTAKLYQKRKVRLRLEDGAPVEALAYVATEVEPGCPAPDYLNGILFGAQFFRLPVEYRNELERWRVAALLPAQGYNATATTPRPDS